MEFDKILRHRPPAVLSIPSLPSSAPDKLAAAKQTFTEREYLGLCQRATCPFVSRLQIVTKKGGSLFTRGDQRRLNTEAEPGCSPLPQITSFLCLRIIVVKSYPCKRTFKTPDHRYVFRDLHSSKHVCLHFDDPPLTPLNLAPTKSSKERRMLSYFV